MKDLIGFLKVFENSAFKLYSECADYFAADPELSSFLRAMSKDEALHFHFMASAENAIEGPALHLRSAFALDKNTQLRIQGPIDEARRLLEDRHLEKNVLIEKVVLAEYSEWNDIFVM